MHRLTWPLKAGMGSGSTLPLRCWRTGIKNRLTLEIFSTLNPITWDGKKLNHQFSIDFIKEKLGLPHQMRFGAYALYAKRPPNDRDSTLALK